MAFPDDFTEMEVRFAVEVGTEAVRRLRALQVDAATQDQLLYAVRQAFDTKLREEMDGLTARLAVADAKNEAVAHVETRNRDLDRELQVMRQEVAARRQEAAAQAARADREQERLRREAERVAAEAAKMREELQRQKIAGCKGEVGEAAVFEACAEQGVYVRRVGGNDAHHGHYHDLLASLSPLCALPHREYPAYASDDDGASRLSIEVKAHKGSNKITAEVEKFLQRRGEMQREGLADCFLFVATAAIPGQSTRSKVQVHRVDETFCITAMIGAPDLKTEEIALTARLILATQARLQDVRRPPLQDEQVEAARVWSAELLRREKRALARVDEQLRVAEQLVAGAKASRLEAVETLVQSYAVFLTNGFVEAEAELQDLAEIVDAVREGGRRPSNSKIVRYANEFRRLADVLTESSKRPRDE